MHHRLTGNAALVVGLAIAALTGCSSPAPGTTTAPTDVTQPAAPQAVEHVPTAAFDHEPVRTTAKMRTHRGWLDRYTDVLLNTEDPTGTGPQIAQRFLRALQVGDDLTAAQQLSAGERITAALHDMKWLHRVMDDVRRHAHLQGAVPCSRTDWVNRDAAVVTCGVQQILVHVRSEGFMPGVQIDSYFPHDDVYLGPHSHAYTRYVV